MKKPCIFAATVLLLVHTAYAAERPQVLELFTSQGCSNCPQADALLSDLSENPDLLALSLHVHYWDRLGWKDPFSSPANTDRQRRYEYLLGEHEIYTPQMVVDGISSTIGNDKEHVKLAMLEAKAEQVDVPVTLTRQGQALRVHVGTPANAALPQSANVYAVRFARRAVTEVKAGENEGRTITNVNNVTSIERIGVWRQRAADYRIAMNAGDEGIAVLLQSDVQGKIIGAARYQP